MQIVIIKRFMNSFVKKKIELLSIIKSQVNFSLIFIINITISYNGFFLKELEILRHLTNCRHMN